MELIIIKSPQKDKRYRANFIYNNKLLIYSDFGSKRSSTYLEHNDINIRNNWIARHSKLKGIDWNDPFSPSTLSRYILWEYPTLKIAVRQYKKRFF
jgi:hypothetical protein